MESLLSELATGVQLDTVLNYISVAMLSWVVWDHGLTFTEDVRFIRQLRHGSLGAFLFLANRYGAEIGMASIIYIHQKVFVGSSSSSKTCGTFFVVVALLVVVSLVTENATMTLRMYALWERRRSTLVAIRIALTIMYAGVLIFAVLVFREIYDHASIFELLPIKLCFLLVAPGHLLAVLWSFMFAYDMFMLVMFISNALDQPYRRSSEVFTRLKRNGIVVYCLLAATRICNVIVALKLSPFYVFALFLFEWAISTIGVSRLIVQAETVEKSPREGHRDAYEMSVWFF